MTDKKNKFLPVNISILTISSTRNKKDDISGKTLEKRIKKSGHILSNYEVIKDDKDLIKEKIRKWSDDVKINVIITTGGTGLTGSDVTPEAVEDLFDKKIEGFSIIFHLISFQKIRTSTLQSRALAGIVNQTYVFCLPGSPNAVKDAWDDILIYQLDNNHKPCNFIEILDRLEE